MQDNNVQGHSGGNPNVERVLQLSRRQTHWLERFVMPGLACLFSISVLALACQYITVLLPRVFIPRWLVAVGALAALESVYAVGFHIRLRTPISLRVAEFAIVLGLAYGCLRAGRVGLTYPWLSAAVWREPEIVVSLLLVAGVWGLARGYGQTFVWLGDIAREVGDQGAVTFSWEVESYLSNYRIGADRAQALGYFTRRYLFYAWTACIFNAIIIEAFPDRLVHLVGWHSVTNLATLGLLLSGMLLQACVYLYRLQVIWNEVGIPVGRELPRQWLFSSVAFVCLVLALAVILPAGVSPLSFSRTMETVTSWIGAGVDISLPEREIRNSGPFASSSGSIGPTEVSKSGWLIAILYFTILVILGLLALVALIALVGLVLYVFFRDEWERLHGLARIPVYVYLWVKETLRELIRIVKKGAKEGRRLWGKLQRAKDAGKEDRASEQDLQGKSAPSVPVLYIRHLFVLLMKDAARSGLVPRASQTPLEYSAGLSHRLDDGQEELELLTDYYVRARYSNHEFTPGIRPVVKSLWEKVMVAVEHWRFGDDVESNEDGNLRKRSGKRD